MLSSSTSRHFSDKQFEWRPKSLYIPVSQFSGLDYETTTATDIKSVGTGAANDTAIAEVNTSGVVGLNMTANANSVEHFLFLPYDVDISKNIYFSVCWTANNTSGSVTWDVLFKQYIPGITVIGTAPAAVTLSKAIGLQNMAGVAFTIMQTPEGVLAGGVLNPAVRALQLGVVRTTVATITTAVLLGLEIRYSPRALRGPDGMAAEAKLASPVLGKTYS